MLHQIFAAGAVLADGLTFLHAGRRQGRCVSFQTTLAILPKRLLRMGCQKGSATREHAALGDERASYNR